MKDNVLKTCCKQGFTLIELLVVVLIIAILAAVALPQYNKAVKKAHGAEVLMALDALDKALASYYLEHGSYEGASEGLNLEIPELSHFRYNVGTGGYASGVSSIHMQVGSWDSPLYTWNGGANLKVSIVSPEGVSLQSVWEKGKLSSRICKRVDVYGTSCADYFNCNATPIERIEGDPQLGCSDYYIGGECTL